MIIGRRRFNIYLLLCFAAAALMCGCHTTGNSKKQISTVRLHIEVSGDSSEFSRSVPIFREKPVLVNVDKSPFLTEANISGAKVVEVSGGYALQLQFDRQGTWLLEEYTTTNPGRHIAIFSEFGGKKRQARWLGAPIIARRISNGILTFTPDATREEAEEVALGLNNVGKKNAKQSEW